MIDINEEKKKFATLIGGGFNMEDAFMCIAIGAATKGVLDGYPNTPLDEAAIRMFFVNKLRKTKSLDEAFLKAIWRAYEHKYTDDD